MSPASRPAPRAMYAAGSSRTPNQAAGWKAAAHGTRLRRRFRHDDSEMLVRMPAGFPSDFEFADDLRRKNFAALRPLGDDAMTGPRLLATLRSDLETLAPFVDYLCASLDLEF